MIDRCWQLGRRQSDPVDPRRRRRRPVERAARAGARRRRRRRALRSARDSDRRAGHVAAARSGATKRRSATCSRSRPRALERFDAICERERCPFAVVGTRDRGRATRRRRSACSATRRSTCRLDVLLGKPPKMTRDVGTSRAGAAAARPRRHRAARRRVSRAAAAGGGRQDVPDHDRRSHRRRLDARDPMVGPWQVPVADVAVTLLDFDGYCRRGDGDGRAHAARADRRAGVGPHGGRRGDHQHRRRGRSRSLRDVKLSANWMAAAGHPGEDAALYDTVRAVALELCPRSASRFRSARIRCRCSTTWREGDVDKCGHRAGVADRLGVRAGARRARTLTPQLQLDRGDTALVLIDLGGGQEPARRLGARAGLRPARRRVRRISTIRGGSRAFFALVQAAASRRHAARLSRPLRRRAVRHAVRRWRSRRAADSTSTLDGCAGDAACARCSPRSSAPCCRSRAADRCDACAATRGAHGLARHACIGRLGVTGDRMRIAHADGALRASTRRASTCIAPGRRRRMRCSALRDNPDCADEEYDAHARRNRSRARADADVRSRRRRRGAVHRHRRAAARRDPARAGRQRPGRDGGGVRPRRLRRVRRAHERPHRRPRIARRLPGARRVRRLLLRRRARRRRGLGQVDPVQRARARRVRGVLRAQRHASRSASATAAR